MRVPPGASPASRARRRAGLQASTPRAAALRDARRARRKSRKSGEEGEETRNEEACTRTSGPEGCTSLQEEVGEEGEGTSRPRAGQRLAHQRRGRSIATGLIGPVAIRPCPLHALVVGRRPEHVAGPLRKAPSRLRHADVGLADVGWPRLVRRGRRSPPVCSACFRFRSNAQRTRSHTPQTR
jgi:hypothetical protein